MIFLRRSITAHLPIALAGYVRRARRALRGGPLVLLAAAATLLLIVKLGQIGSRAPDVPPQAASEMIELWARPRQAMWPLANGLPEPAAGPDGAGEPERSSEAPTAAERAADALAERIIQLDRRVEELDLREALIRNAEAGVADEIEGLTALRDEVQGLLQELSADEEQRIQALVKIYETMKPRQAARIFDGLDLSVLLPVVRRMRESKTAAIVASMDPARARRLTTELARERNIDPGAMRAGGA